MLGGRTALGGLALAFSRLIDNSVIVLENIFRHLEMGTAPEVAAEKGGKEVALAVLAAYGLEALRGGDRRARRVCVAVLLGLWLGGLVAAAAGRAPFSDQLT